MSAQPQPGRFIHVNDDFLVVELRLQFNQEFIYYVEYGLVVQRIEFNDGVQAVTEFRAESLDDGFHGVRTVILLGKTD